MYSYSQLSTIFSTPSRSLLIQRLLYQLASPPLSSRRPSSSVTKFSSAFKERDENQRKLLDAYQELDEELLKRETLVAKNEELQEEIEVASQQLIQADKLATLGTVVAGVAHDIASPTGLILFANEAVSENRKSSMELIEGIFEADDSDEARAVLQMFRQKFEKISKSESDIELGISRINAIQSAIRNQSRNDQSQFPSP